jgi:uncharacterized phage protein gp47/JayE
MPLNIPSRPDLQTQILADMQARIPGADTSLRRSTIRVLAYVWAGSLWLVYRFIAWLAKQLFIDSAETAYLERRLAPYGIVREGATFAAGLAIFTGTATILVPLGTQVQTSDGTILFATQADATIDGTGTVTVAIEALIAGAAGNVPGGAALALTTAISGVQPTAAVDPGGLSGGTDAESDPALRIRGEARIQQPPHGGAGFDYVAWAKQVPGVSRVWTYPLRRGLGTVDVAFVMDGRTSNIPLTADLTAVQAAIDAASPVTADALAVAPTADAQAITIANLLPATAAMRNAIIASLDALAATIAPGGATIGDGVTTAKPGGTLQLQQIYAAINAASPFAYDLTVPTGDITFATVHLPGVWAVTFV